MNCNELSGNIESDRWSVLVEKKSTRTVSDFFYGVRSTKIYCRPNCPSRLPLQQNVVFFDSTFEAEESGYRACHRCQPSVRPSSSTIVELICRYIEANRDTRLSLSMLGEQVGVSPSHLQRVFKSVTGISPRQYAEELRLKDVKNQLHKGKAITESLIEAGYGSTSRFYERSNHMIGMTPTAYKKGGASVSIHYATAETQFGQLLVAATSIGICSVTLGNSDEELEEALLTEYTSALIIRDDSRLQAVVDQVQEHLSGIRPDLDLNLDIAATAFQRRVWNALQTVPYGETRTYAQLAVAIDKPEAVRAVANACAANPVALAIPCHRIIRSNGGLGGYRWGEARKKQILEKERAERS